MRYTSSIFSMTMDGSFALRHRPEAASEAGRLYERAVTQLAQDVIYHKITLADLQQRITRARMNDAVNALEKDAHTLEAIFHLYKGIEAQEQADRIHGSAWQAVLLRQPITHRDEPKPPETLTRNEVAQEFIHFNLRQELIDAEDKALQAYQRFVEVNGDRAVSVTNTIQLKRSDIEVLMIDLQVRQVERLMDPEERKAKLLELNRRLAQLIQQLIETREDGGKCLELQEMYLFRRLVTMADTGHLASIRHGNPRQDLKRDTDSKERSIDMVITLAGERLHLQMKTLKSNVSTEARWNQNDILERSREHLEGSTTRLTRFETEAVEAAYVASQRKPEGEPTSLHDKQKAFAPLAHDLRPDIAQRFKVLLGLDPVVCEREMADFREQERTLNEYLEARRAEQAEVQARLHAQADAYQATVQAEAQRRAEEEARRQQRVADVQREAVEESQRKRDEESVRNAVKLAKLDATLQEVVQKQKRQAAAAKAAATRAEGAKAIPDWIPKKPEVLATAAALQRLGFIPDGNLRDIDAKIVMAAKQEFIDLFGKPKALAAMFDTKKQFDEPTPDILGQITTLRKNKK